MKPELAKALLAVQQEAPAIQSDGINPHFKSRYVTLESLMRSILPVLNKHGVVLIQSPTSDGTLLTTLVHAETGEERGGSIPLMLSKDDAQGQGSAITYARRYALMSMLGLVADEDDDGNQASRSRPNGQSQEKSAREPNPASDLIEGAIQVRSAEDANSIRLAQRDLAPKEDWPAIEAQLAHAVFDAGLDELTRAQTGQWWRRLANAVAKSYENGDFPPPSREEIQAAYAWAFDGTVLELSSLETPFENTEEES